MRFAFEVNHVAGASADAKKRDQSRANKESGDRMSSTGLIGGEFSVHPNPEYVQTRDEIFERIWAEKQAAIDALPPQEITITLPNGDVKKGIAFKTSPLDIAKEISTGLADSVVIAKVAYSNKLEQDNLVACDEDEESAAEHQQQQQQQSEGELWDLNRPLVGDCQLKLLKFDEPEAKTVRNINCWTCTVY